LPLPRQVSGLPSADTRPPVLLLALPPASSAGTASAPLGSTTSEGYATPGAFKRVEARPLRAPARTSGPRSVWAVSTGDGGESMRKRWMVYGMAVVIGVVLADVGSFAADRYQTAHRAATVASQGCGMGGGGCGEMAAGGCPMHAAAAAKYAQPSEGAAGCAKTHSEKCGGDCANCTCPGGVCTGGCQAGHAARCADGCGHDAGCVQPCPHGAPKPTPSST